MRKGALLPSERWPGFADLPTCLKRYSPGSCAAFFDTVHPGLWLKWHPGRLRYAEVGVWHIAQDDQREFDPCGWDGLVVPGPGQFTNIEDAGPGFGAVARAATREFIRTWRPLLESIYSVPALVRERLTACMGKAKGIEWKSIVPIDSPRARPYDAVILGMGGASVAICSHPQVTWIRSVSDSTGAYGWMSRYTPVAADQVPRWDPNSEPDAALTRVASSYLAGSGLEAALAALTAAAEEVDFNDYVGS